jgi:hypothetical protein
MEHLAASLMKSSGCYSLFQQTCRELFLSSLQQACYQTCAKPVYNKQFCPVTTSFNKPVVGKQIENVSKEKNSTKWTFPASLSHSIIAIGNIY